ncbi:DUF3072 domain-containing protein [Lapillicoccus sp.]|uniref:DUF3072 domain-containing protein n=1 Tax=Lapillicoccus sp. TaxID=1909287 RepID=UPI0025EA422D|nr:DUF3072 domain-containing protein [Lapillicoccus sp.]
MSNETPVTATPETTMTAEETEPETLGASEPTDDPALEKDPADWVSGGDPITEAQKSYLDTLARQAGEELPADMTKAEASQHIVRLRGKNDLD